MKYDISSLLLQATTIIKKTAFNSEKRRLTVYGDKIKCSVSCEHCCSRPISPTILESAVIIDYLKSKNRWIEVKNRVRELREYDNIDKNTWYMLQLKCPVLDPVTKKCLAYEVRPMTCSTHYVESSPSSCDPMSLEPLNYKPVDMLIEYDEAAKSMEVLCGNSFWSQSLFIVYGLLLAEGLLDNDGLSLNQILKLIARDSNE